MEAVVPLQNAAPMEMREATPTLNECVYDVTTEPDIFMMPKGDDGETMPMRTVTAIDGTTEQWSPMDDSMMPEEDTDETMPMRTVTAIDGTPEQWTPTDDDTNADSKENTMRTRTIGATDSASEPGLPTQAVTAVASNATVPRAIGAQERVTDTETMEPSQVYPSTQMASESVPRAVTAAFARNGSLLRASKLRRRGWILVPLS